MMTREQWIEKVSKKYKISKKKANALYEKIVLKKGLTSFNPYDIIKI